MVEAELLYRSSTGHLVDVMIKDKEMARFARDKVLPYIKGQLNELMNESKHCARKGT